MARPVRIKYTGAVSHIVTWENNRQAHFRDDHNCVTYPALKPSTPQSVCR